MPRGQSKHLDGGQWPVEGFDTARHSQSLFRGLAILESYTPSRQVQGIKEIANRVGLSQSTTHRYVTTLVAGGYLEQTATRRYRLGSRVNDLGRSALSSADPSEQVESYLMDLRSRTGYTASFAVLDGTEVLCIKRVHSFRRGQHRADRNVREGSSSPAYCTASGKVLLANLPRSERDRLIRETELERRGPNTITSKKALRVELDRVRKDGIAVNDEELYEGLIGIAAGVCDGNREVVGAISLAAHVSMIYLEGMVDALSPHLQATAAQISARFGYRRDDEVAR